MEPTITQDFPKHFFPYENINFCGNELHNVRILIDYKGYIPVIIGKEDFPLIWIYNRMKEGDEFLFQIAVERSVAIHPAIKVEHNERSKRLRVTAEVKGEKITIISVNYSEDTLLIDSFNLKNLGMDIHGNDHELWVSDTRISNNIISDADEFITLID